MDFMMILFSLTIWLDSKLVKNKLLSNYKYNYLGNYHDIDIFI